MEYLHYALSLLVVVSAGVIYLQWKNISRLKETLNRLSEPRHDFKTKLISMLAHDFSGTFRNTISLIELHQNGEIPPESFTPLFEELRSTSRNNLDAFERTMQWVKTQMDGYQYRPEPLSISQVIDVVARQNSPEFKRKEIALAVKGDKEAKMLADVQLMRFVLNSIIHNGIKFSYPGGVIECEIRKGSNSKVRVRISDSGTGMDAQTMDELFSPNKTLYNGTLGEKGAGIALLICRDFVKMQHSKLEAASRKGAGSVFTLTVPRA